MITGADVPRLLTAWGVSVIAETAALVALLVVAYDTGGPPLVALLAAVRALPVLVVGPIVIGRSDRGRREVWLVGTLAVRACLLGAAVALLWADRAVPALVVGGTASLLFSTHRPLNAALLPQLARTPAELTSSNAAMALAESGGGLLGPGLAAVALVVSAPIVVLGAAGLLVGVAAGVASGVRTSGTPRAASAPLGLATAVRDLASGFRLLTRPPMLLVLVAGQTFARGVLLVAVVVLAKQTFGTGDPGVGWLNALLGLGGLAGAALAAWKVTSTSLARAYVLGVLLWGAPMVALGVWTNEPVGYLAFAVIGFGNAILDVGVFTLVARLVPRDRLGRAFAAFEVVIVVCVTAGSLVASAVVDQVGVAALLAAVGALLVGTALAFVAQAVAVDRGLVPHPHTSLLRGCDVLSGLPLVTVEHLAETSRRRRFDSGDTVVRQGDPGTEFFVVISGQVDVDVDGRPAATLGAGDGFGEIALLREIPRTATVTARTPVEVLVVSQRDFLTFVAGHSASAVSVSDLADARVHRNSRLHGDDAD
jgi:predicted MFS family arabinose efflux permease